MAGTIKLNTTVLVMVMHYIHYDVSCKRSIWYVIGARSGGCPITGIHFEVLLDTPQFSKLIKAEICTIQGQIRLYFLLGLALGARPILNVLERLSPELYCVCTVPGENTATHWQCTITHIIYNTVHLL